MTANTPPKPHTEGMEWTNTETGIKYMFTNGGWRAVSSEASEEVADAIDGLDLQTVLDNGNVADKGAIFDEPVSVGFDEFNPLESHAVTFGYYDEGQGVQNDNISDLQNSVATLQQEIEALGTVVNKSVPHKLIKQSDDVQNQLDNGGFFFGDCPAGNMLDVPDDWSGICFIYVDTVDNNGDFADFGPDSLEPGDLIEGVSETGYFLVEVGLGGYDEGAGKKIAGIEATLLKASGVPGAAGQDYALTAFRLTSNGGIDLPTADERYVKKTGDTMTGMTTVKPSTGSTSFAVWPAPNANPGQYTSYVYGRIVEDGITSTPIVFGVTRDGRIYSHESYSPSSDRHLTPKKYVDDTVKQKASGTPYVYTNKTKDTLAPGEFCQKMSDNAYHCHPTDANGVNHNTKNVNQTFSGAWFVFKIFDENGNKVVSHTGTTVYAKSGKYFAWSRSKIMVEERLTEGKTYYLKDDYSFNCKIELGIL